MFKHSIQIVGKRNKKKIQPVMNEIPKMLRKQRMLYALIKTSFGQFYHEAAFDFIAVNFYCGDFFFFFRSAWKETGKINTNMLFTLLSLNFEKQSN